MGLFSGGLIFGVKYFLGKTWAYFRGGLYTGGLFTGFYGIYPLFPFSIFAGDTRNAKLNNEAWNDPKKSTLLEEIVLNKGVKTIYALR